MRKGEELKAPRYASAVATRNGNLPLRNGSLPYVTATCLIPDNNLLNNDVVVILVDLLNVYKELLEPSLIDRVLILNYPFNRLLTNYLGMSTLKPSHFLKNN